MYSVQHIAARLGITPRQVRKYLRTLGDHTPGARYEFSHHELERIVSQYAASRPAGVETTDTSAPGLPVAWLRDRSQRARFHRLRLERLERLEEQMKARGVSLGQLDESALVVTGRVLSLKDYS